ncbi:tRNA pseudouridine38-40 synthase [Fistulifera solaris]|jgi:tRNA pseudouridine38-40 synthase|uniref:tRNA pseudouridine synthase n=1 Tax=Fistulifera solaris TaxID=1519565 RepID=A0A1Z5KBH7_FISSO|nr:tRNA pseudouridine38-40 synthase [Fistulifera solaris]|eukprot:GAX23556.1 tRNA pseudouridine38-40 synthase [Fistulifera solaris]
MYAFIYFILLELTVLSKAWVPDKVSILPGTKRLSLTVDANTDDCWTFNETWPQKQMRRLWEKEPHSLLTLHVRRMISGQESVLNTTAITDSVFSLPFQSTFDPTFQAFYEGRFPIQNNQTNASIPSKKRKKISYRLDFAYDGTQFAGWQRQADAKLVTVQECIEQYFCRLTGEETVDVRVAGRTDAGVHAVGQVGRIRLSQPLMHRQIWMKDLCVWSITEVPSNFHPSFGSKSRSYVYMIDAAALDNLLLQELSEKGISDSIKQDNLLHLVERMNDLLETFVGQELDYFAFSYGRVKTETTLCCLSQACARLVQNGDAGHRAIVIELTGNRFLRRMVRILVATVLQSALFPDSSDGTLLDLVELRDRSKTAPPAPAAGLVFVSADC